MSITDTIADMATVIRNAVRAGKKTVDIKASNVNEEILKILKNESFIETYKRMEDTNQGMLRVYFKFGEEKTSVLSNIKRISRPGLRDYRKKDDIEPVLGGLGISIVSTSQGIISDREARERNLGGEVMLEVW